MTRQMAEILILIPTVLFTGTVMYVASVLKLILDDLDESNYKAFIDLLVKNAKRSRYILLAATLTTIGMIPYLIYFRFSNWWFITGYLFFILADVIYKIMALPVYKKVGSLKSSDTVELSEQRKKMTRTNNTRAILYSICTVLMVIGILY